MEHPDVFKISRTTFTKSDNSKISNIWIMVRNKDSNSETK